MNISLPSTRGNDGTSLYYSIADNQLVILVLGEGTMDNGPALEKFMFEILEIQVIHLDQVMVDLSQCSYSWA